MRNEGCRGVGEVREGRSKERAPLPHFHSPVPHFPSANLPSPLLLAVDLGLSTGLAAFGRDGHLVWCRSHHIGNRAALKRAAYGVMNTLPALEALALEGGGPLAAPWLREAARRGLSVLTVHAYEWRAALLPEATRPGGDLKALSIAAARRVIAASALPQPKALRHDTAEAVLTGVWALRTLGWPVPA
jgi:hypothetical protein